MIRMSQLLLYAAGLTLLALLAWQVLDYWGLADWHILLPYLLGVLTGLAIAGWSPEWLERWEAQREEQRRERVSNRMKALVKREAEKIDREQGPPV